MMRCSLCLQQIGPRGRYSRNWHLVSECKCKEVVKLRRRLQAEVSLAFEYSQALSSKLDWLCAPWMLRKDGTVVDFGVAEELALVLDTEDSDRILRWDRCWRCLRLQLELGHLSGMIRGSCCTKYKEIVPLLKIGDL